MTGKICVKMVEATVQLDGRYQGKRRNANRGVERGYEQRKCMAKRIFPPADPRRRDNAPSALRFVPLTKRGNLSWRKT